MAVKNKLKNSDLGPIPVDWNVCPLGSLTTKVGSGITPRGGERVYKTEGRPFLRSQNVGWGELILDDVAFIDEETHYTFSSTELKENDVLLNITGASIGRSTVADSRIVGGNVNQHVCIIRTDDHLLYPQYLNLFLLSVSGQKQIDSFQAGGNRQGLNFGQIKSFLLPLPPLPEQQTIADTLSDMDALLASQDVLIAKKRLIKQGAMQELLTGKRRLPGFSGEWKKAALGELCYLITKQTGFDYSATIKPSLSRQKINGYIPFIQNKDFEGTRINFDTDFYIPEKIANKFPDILLDDPCLLISISGRIGNVGYFDGSLKAFIGGAVGIARFYKPTLAIWAMLYLLSNDGQEQIFQNEKAGAQHNITIGDVRKLVIPLPDEKEQIAISTIISDIDTEIEFLSLQLKKAKQIKQGMMQELLTGRTRLV